jgi:hypothetical protein
MEESGMVEQRSALPRGACGEEIALPAGAGTQGKREGVHHEIMETPAEGNWTISTLSDNLSGT